ncbi:MAG: hypothetical protein ACTTKH_02370 [Treponema sp.]
MKRFCNIVNMGGGIAKLVLSLLVFVALFSCNHGNGEKENKPDGGKDSLTKLTLKQLIIKGQPMELGTVTFKGESVTINKEEVIISFKELDAPKDFIFSENFPITLEKGKSKTLKISTKKTEKYKEWTQDVILTCSNLEVLKIESIKIHNTKVKDDGTIKLSETFKDVKEGNVAVKFEQTDAPAHRFEGLPITLKAGQEAKFKIITDANTKYDSFSAEITVIGEEKVDPATLVLKKIEVHGVEVKGEEVTIPLQYASVTKENIKIYFNEDDAPNEVKCEPETLSLNAGEEKPLKIYTEATVKYKKFEKTIKVKREEKKELHIKTLTIHGKNATSGNVSIKEENTTKANVTLAFLETDAPTEFTVSPDPLTLAKNETKVLKISTAETEKYKAWEFSVNIKKAKEDSEPKDIDDVIEALKSQLTWVDSYVEDNIQLLNSVIGFADSNIEWEALDAEHCDKMGHIHRDIADVKVQLKATVTWQGNIKTVTLSTTIKRLEKIEKTNNRPDGSVATYTWDFSEKGFLKYSIDGKASYLWEIKNVDVKKKEFTVSLKKRVFGIATNKFLELEEYIKLEENRNEKNINNYFGALYIALKNKSVIKWEDFKPYVLGLEFSDKTEDDKIFEDIKGIPFWGSYSGTFAEFNALNDAERTKIIKDVLNNFKLHVSKEFNILENTPDEKFAEILLEKTKQAIRARVEKYAQEWKYSYKVEHDGKELSARVIYDNTKKWCEQIGEYQNNSGGRISFEKLNDNEVKINIFIQKNNAYYKFLGECLIAQSNSFTLKNDKDASKELQCAIIDAKDGKITLTTAGALDETFNMEFNGERIDECLRLGV